MGWLERFLHKVLGWHYVLVVHKDDSKVRRVKFNVNGVPFVHVWSLEPTLLNRDGTCDGAASYYHWKPLTWSSEPPASEGAGR